MIKCTINGVEHHFTGYARVVPMESVGQEKDERFFMFEVRLGMRWTENNLGGLLDLLIGNGKVEAQIVEKFVTDTEGDEKVLPYKCLIEYLHNAALKERAEGTEN